MTDVLTRIRESSAGQQPEWTDPAQVARVRLILAARPPLVRFEDVRTLRSLLAQVAAGHAHVVQTGDCAEDPEECTPAHVWRKSAVLDLLAGTLKLTTHLPVLRVGRIAGQFAKPRTKPTERVGGVDLPVYRGHMVNSPEPDAENRMSDPLRILTCYMAANDIVEHLGWRHPRNRKAEPAIEPLVWISHEALLLDYEIPMLRETGDGRLWLGSTHWPWIGERTRRLDGAHVAMLAQVANPLGCKVGPSMTSAEIVSLCERLDPGREPGRLTLIARMGADMVAERLPPLVEAVRAAGHPAIWLCDPMHGNTVTAPDGHKTRMVATVAREVREFRAAVIGAGGVAGGLHLETTPDDVTECATDHAALDSVGDRYTSFCDPRLTPDQAITVVSAWTD
jgi:3-deoxy-7-phosphoheptulonate synthase